LTLGSRARFVSVPSPRAPHRLTTGAPFRILDRPVSSLKYQDFPPLADLQGSPLGPPRGHVTSPSAPDPRMVKSTRSPTASAPTPVTEAERVGSLDTLRGFALLGILVMNIQTFAMPEAAYLNPTVWGDLTGANLQVWLLSHLLTDQKMMAIFSMLFGAGIALFADRAAAQGRSPVRLHLRRSSWLLLFGAAHGYLLWYGDILFLYAVCAFVVFWFRDLAPRRLLVLGILVLAVSSTIYLAMGASLPTWPPEARAEFIRDVWSPSEEALAAEVAAVRGSWLEQLEHRFPTTLMMQTFVLAIWGFWRAAGLMLIGMALYRLGVFSARRSNQFYLRLVAAGVLVGLPLAGYGIYWNFSRGWSPLSFFYGSQFNYWGSILVSLGWVGVVMLVYRRGILVWLSSALAAVGRTAFSNYILQTLICTTIFYGHGLGLFGQVERTGQIGIVFAVWAFQLAVSPIWLRHFRFGPLEWLWRCLTYGRVQPIRKGV
jgi:uncharacterized protein